MFHRDIKPSNILIDQHDQVRITDFGLAGWIQRSSSLTRTGQALGTPGYMPPEQAAGRKALVGPTSDVYALGAVLYALLTGRPPFYAETPAQTLQQVLHAEPPSPRVENPRVSSDLATICLKCLQKEPRWRYRTAALLAQDLERFLDGKPILARPLGLAERSRRWCMRNPALAALATVAAGLLGVLSAIVMIAINLEPNPVSRSGSTGGENPPSAIAEPAAAAPARSLAAASAASLAPSVPSALPEPLARARSRGIGTALGCIFAAKSRSMMNCSWLYVRCARTMRGSGSAVVKCSRWPINGKRQPRHTAASRVDAMSAAKMLFSSRACTC